MTLKSRLWGGLVEERKKLQNKIVERVKTEISNISITDVYDLAKDAAVKQVTNINSKLVKEIEDYFETIKDDVEVRSEVQKANQLAYKDDVTTKEQHIEENNLDEEAAKNLSTNEVTRKKLTKVFKRKQKELKEEKDKKIAEINDQINAVKNDTKDKLNNANEDLEKKKEAALAALEREKENLKIADGNAINYIEMAFSEAFVAYSALKKYDEKYKDYEITEEILRDNELKKANPFTPLRHIPTSKKDARAYFDIVVSKYAEFDDRAPKLISMVILTNELSLTTKEMKRASVKNNGGWKKILKYTKFVFELTKPHLKAYLTALGVKLIKSTEECVEISNNVVETEELLEETSVTELEKALKELEDYEKLNLAGPPMESDIVDYLIEHPELMQVPPMCDSSDIKQPEEDDDCCFAPPPEITVINPRVNLAVVEMCRTITEYTWYVDIGDEVYQDQRIASFVNYEGLTVDVYSPVTEGIVIDKRLFSKDFNNIVIKNYGPNTDVSEYVQAVYKRYMEILMNTNHIKDLFYSLYGDSIYPFIAWNKDYHYFEDHPFNIDRKTSKYVYDENMKRIRKAKDKFIKRQSKKDYAKMIKGSEGDPDVLDKIKEDAENEINNFIFSELYNIVEPIFNYKTPETKVTYKLNDLRNLGTSYYLDLILKINGIDMSMVLGEEATDWMDNYYDLLLGIINKRLILEINDPIKIREHLDKYYQNKMRDLLKTYSIKHNRLLEYEQMKDASDAPNFNFEVYLSNHIDTDNMEALTAIKNLYVTINDLINAIPKEIEEAKTGLSNKEIRELIKSECDLIKQFFEDALNAYDTYVKSEIELLEELSEIIYTFPPEFDIETFSGTYKIYQINNSTKYTEDDELKDLSNITMGAVNGEGGKNAKEIFDDEFSPYTQVPLTSYKYWRKHFALDTLLSLPYLVTWLWIPAVIRINLPVIYIPLKVFRSRNVIFVLGLGFAGMGTYPLLLVCNLDQKQSTIATSLLIALDAVSNKFTQLIDGTLVAARDLVNKKLHGLVGDIANFKNRISTLENKLEDNRIMMGKTDAMLESLNKKMINNEEFEAQLEELDKLENKLKLYDEEIKYKIK